ncbi:hypothetical protein D6817_02795 [Candidatus Pacearchaeota archaeon]|nr:MAG: hypothetical protein D6817_02795 [Candidatus Pacearchaeota archaeon]
MYCLLESVEGYNLRKFFICLSLFLGMGVGIESVLEPEEQIVWRDVVSRKVLATFLVIWLVLILAVSIFFFLQGEINFKSGTSSRAVPGWAVGLGLLLLGSAISLWAFFSDLVKEYAITQKRVVIKSGLIGTDFKSIYFDQIKEVLVNVGLVGKIFGVGTVKIDTGKTETYSEPAARMGRYSVSRVRTRVMYDLLKHIHQPYEVYRYLQQALSERKEALYSGRADKESNPQAYSAGQFG